MAERKNGATFHFCFFVFSFFCLLLIILSLIGFLGAMIAGEENHPSGSRDVIFQTKASGEVNESQRIISDEKEYNKLVEKLFPSYPEELKVDFSQHDVFIAFLGERPNGCYGIEIGKVEFGYPAGMERESEVEKGSAAREKILKVEIIEKVPARNCLCPQVIVAPAVAIRIPKIEVKGMEVKRSESPTECD